MLRQIFRAFSVAVAAVAFGSAALGQTTTAPSTLRPASAVVQALSGTPGVNPGMSREDLLKLVGELVQAKDTDRAEKIVSELLSDDRDNVDALWQLGRVYEVQSSAAAARGPDSKAEAEEKARNAVRTYLYAAPRALAGGRDKLAEQMYTRVIAYSKGSADAVLGLARILARTGREMLAIDRYREYLKLPLAGEPAGRRTYSDVDSKALLELGRLYRQAKLLSQSTAMLLAAQKLNLEEPEISIELARTYRDAGSFEKAITAARHALSGSPENPEYHTVMATILQVAGGLPEAAKEASQAIQLAWNSLREKRDNPELLQSLSGTYRIHEQILQAQLASKPEDAAIRLALARSIQDQAAVDGTLAMYRVLSVLKDAPAQEKPDVAILEALVQAQFAVGKPAEAAATCEQLIRLSPGSAVGAEMKRKLSAGGASEPGGSAASAPAAGTPGAAR